MKRILCILLFTQLSSLNAMQKQNLLQTYKNWAFARTIAHFTQPPPYNPNGTPLEACKFIPLKDLHAELNRQIKNHLFINYVVLPTAGVVSIVATALVAYNALN